MEITRQQAIDLQQDIKWRGLRNELEKIMESEREKLLTAEGNEVVRFQERIRAFRFVIRLPEIIAEREEDIIDLPEGVGKIITGD